MEILFWLVAGHFIGDFTLQHSAMAMGKNPANQDRTSVPWYYWLASHSFTHGAIVAFATGSCLLGAMETICHAAIDWMKCRRFFGIHADQILHLVCKSIWFYCAVHSS